MRRLQRDRATEAVANRGELVASTSGRAARTATYVTPETSHAIASVFTGRVLHTYVHGDAVDSNHVRWFDRFSGM